MLSATAPPTSEPISSGGSWAMLTNPTCSDEPVSTYTWYATATTVSWLPTNETSCPEKRRRNSLDRRSGVTSVRRRRAMGPAG